MSGAERSALNSRNPSGFVIFLITFPLLQLGYFLSLLSRLLVGSSQSSRF